MIISILVKFCKYCHNTIIKSFCHFLAKIYRNIFKILLVFVTLLVTWMFDCTKMDKELKK